MRFLELLVGLFLLWVAANVVRAFLFKASQGGGFWAISDLITSKDREKLREKQVEEEVQRRLAARLAQAELAAKEGGAAQGKA